MDTERINLAIRPDLKAMIREAAKREHMSVSGWLKHIALREIQNNHYAQNRGRVNESTS